MSQEQDNRPSEQPQRGFLERIHDFQDLARDIQGAVQDVREFVHQLGSTAELAGKAFVEGDERANKEWDEKYEDGRTTSQKEVNERTANLMQGAVAQEFTSKSRRIPRLRNFEPFESYFEKAVQFHLAENLATHHRTLAWFRRGAALLQGPVVDQQPQMAPKQYAGDEVAQAIADATYHLKRGIHLWGKGDPEYAGRASVALDLLEPMRTEGQRLMQEGQDYTHLRLVDGAAKEVSFYLVVPQNPTQLQARQQLIAEKVHEFRTGRAKKLLRRY